MGEVNKTVYFVSGDYDAEQISLLPMLPDMQIAFLKVFISVCNNEFIRDQAKALTESVISELVSPRLEEIARETASNMAHDSNIIPDILTRHK